MALVFLETIILPFTITGGFHFIGFERMLTIDNVVPILCTIVMAMGGYALNRLKNKGKNRSSMRPREFKEIKPWEYDYVPTFVTLLAIVSFNYSGFRGLFLFIVIMLIIYGIFVSTTMFYTSPLYRILGLNIYQTTDEGLGGNVIMMTFEALSKTEILYCRHIFNNVYYVTKA